MTFQGWLREQRNVSEATSAEYFGDVTLFCNWYAAKTGQELTPALLTRMDVADWLREQADADLSPATRNRRLASLKAWMLWALSEGLTAYNPIATMVGAKTAAPGPRWLRREAQGQTLRVMDRWQAGARTQAAQTASACDRAVYQLMRYAGLRIGEVAALRIQDLQLSDRKGLVIVRHGKGDKYREVPLHKEAREALTAWLAVRPASTDQALFVGKRGPLTANGLWRRVTHLFDLAAVDATPHQLRHTFAREYLAAGGRVDEAQLLLGHTRMDTTLRYATPDQHDLAVGVERMS